MFSGLKLKFASASREAFENAENTDDKQVSYTAQCSHNSSECFNTYARKSCTGTFAVLPRF